MFYIRFILLILILGVTVLLIVKQDYVHALLLLMLLDMRVNNFKDD